MLLILEGLGSDGWYGGVSRSSQWLECRNWWCQVGGLQIQAADMSASALAGLFQRVWTALLVPDLSSHRRYSRPRAPVIALSLVLTPHQWARFDTAELPAQTSSTFTSMTAVLIIPVLLTL